MLILQETMTTLNDTFAIPGHYLVCKLDGKARTPDSGTHIYSRNPVNCNIKLTYNSSCNNGFASKDFYSAISGVSTNYGSQLDYTFYRGVSPKVHFYESDFSDRRAMLIDLSYSKINLVDNRVDKILSSSNDATDNNFTPIHEINQDVIIDQVNNPLPVPVLTVVGNNSRSFTAAMRRTLADTINLQHLPIRPTDFTGATITSTRHYDMMRTLLKSRFNMKLVPVIGDGNCLFRALSHFIFGDESEHNNVRISLINTFEQSPYVSALCALQGYNALTIQQHFSDMKRNYTWGTLNELIMFGILARIHVSYVNAGDPNPSKWAITEIYDENTFSIPNDPIYEGKSLTVLFHSINFSGPSCNHYDAIYDV